MVGRTFPCQSETTKTATSEFKETRQSGPKKTIDLHTATSLIGRLDGLDMSIGSLGLQEHATDGVLTLYSVIRTYRDGENNDGSVGKEVIFRFHSSWVNIPLSATVVMTRKSPVLRVKRKRAMRAFCHLYEYSRHVRIQNLRKTVSSG